MPVHGEGIENDLQWRADADDEERAMTGKQIGPYQILAELGRGGMGEVYRARDTRLNRDVAIKVLPASFAADVERLQRFELEAQAAGRLNHPNVLTVHDIGTHDGAPYLVTELLEGETLRSRLQSASNADGRAQTPLPFRKATDIGRQVAMGLAAAHGAGIIHRDLKPENVFLTSDGRAKILDFGLARIGEREATGASATALQVTNPGTVLGTVGYMAPEQVRGRATDARSDLFALGAMLFEMAGGRRAFERDSAADTMSAILKEDPPDLSGSGISIPPALDRLIKRCLEKNPDERFQSARDLAFAIESLDGSSGTSTNSGGALAPHDVSPRRRKGVILAIVAVAGVVVGAAGGYFAARSGSVSSTATAPLKLRQLTFSAANLSMPALSADGSTLAFVDRPAGNADIYVQRVGGENATNITADSAADDSMPAFSPDGLRIAFRSERDGGGIFIMGPAGESVRRLTTDGFNPAWSPDGKEIAYSTEGVSAPYSRTSIARLWRVDAATGTKTKFYDGDAVQPSWSPDGKFLTFWGRPGGSGNRALYTIALAGGQATLILNDHSMNWRPVWSRDGSFVYFLTDREPPMNVWRIPVDAATGAASGPAERVTLGTTNHSWLSQQSGDAAESLLFAATEHTTVLDRRAISPEGIGPPQDVLRTVRTLGMGALSPDGRSLVFTATDTTEDLVVMRTDGTGRLRLTNDRFKDRFGSWSPDSSTIYFASDRSGQYEVWRIRSDGSGLERITEGDTSRQFSRPLVSPDSRHLAALTMQAGYGISLFDLTVPFEKRTVQGLKAGDASAPSTPLGWLNDGRLVGGSFGIQNASAIVLYSPDGKSTKTLPIPGLAPTMVGAQGVVGSRYVICADAQGLPVLVDVTTGATRKFSAPGFRPGDVLVDISSDMTTAYLTRTESITNLWMIGK